MSVYQALYRKYRPQTFDDVVGQQAVTQTLKTQLSTGKLSHAYLFTGSRGTGKTSSAKILAKAVNCLNPQDGNPCNCCSACRAIDSGSCMDVLEIDAASNNGVDNVRDLRDDAIYTPSQVKMRVYIIDEVHMLSISAFNALLKIIEEPPEHLLFILATTELHKVPATILSRCQRFSFRRISQEDIAARLQYVAYQENIDMDETAARVLARLADGGMRDGLSLLDQVASATTGELTSQQVYNCLGIAGEQRCGELMGYIADHDTKSAMQLFNRLYTEGKDLSAMVAALDENSWAGALSSLKSRKVNLKFPKFETETSLSLNEVLKGMGMTDAFDKTKADFGAMVNADDMFISLIKQDSRIKVDEEGAEAAAITKLHLDGADFPEQQETVKFHADRPFIYLIQEKSSGAIFFAGVKCK